MYQYEINSENVSTFTEQHSSMPTKKCADCGHLCHVRFKKCPGCGQVFSPSKKRIASGAPRKYATDLLSQLQKKVYIIIILLK